MTEPRRSTRARAREEAAPPTPEAPSEKPAKGAKSSLKRKRTSAAVKGSTPGTPVGEAAQNNPKKILPLKIVEGQPLPTLPEPQPLDLSSAEWQNIQQSGVLSASLQRSRAVWVSGVNFRTFHKKHAMPKKVSERTEADKAGKARQKDIEKNFPQVGTLDAQLVIEPHTFPIKIYAPKEGSRPVPKKILPPPQQYGAWPNHSHQNQHPPQYQYNHPPYPPKQQTQPRAPPPKPVQQAPPPTAPGPASTPAPDPVIHMLAARAGTDPELKAVMKIVAAGQASKAQLEFFQTHINELTEILEKNKKAKAPQPQIPAPGPSKQQAHTPAPPKQQNPSPAPPKPQPSSSATPKPQTPGPAPPRPTTAPAPAPSPAQTKQQGPTQAAPAPRPAPPAQQPQQALPLPPATAPKPYGAPPPHAHTQRPPPPQARPPPPPNTYPAKNYNQPPYYQQPPPHYAPSQPPRVTYRPLTFEFVEGNGDRFYFPSYSFMEWLPNGSGAKFSFLVTKLKPKPEGAVKATPKAAPPQTPQTPAPAGATNAAPGATPNADASSNPAVPPTPGGPTLTPTPVTPTPYIAPPRIEDFDERNDMKDIEFYQPVTVLVLSDEHEVKSALPRAIRPPSVVEKYMEEVFDTCKRAEETYLAFRLPKDGNTEVDAGTKSGDMTPSIGTPIADVTMGGLGPAGAEKRKSVIGRSKKSLAG